MQIPARSWLVVSIVATAAGCVHSTPAQRHQYVQVLMGMEVRLVVYGPCETVAKDACKAAFERVAEIDECMSDYHNDSELMQLCAESGPGHSIQVSEQLFQVLMYGQEVSRQSGGAFDMTVGPYVRLWRKARKDHALPTPAELADAQLRVGWQKMKLDPHNRTVELTVPGMRVDLGGIAKGYAGDEAIRVLRDHGIGSAMFEAGGDIVVSDSPPGKNGWTIETIDHRQFVLHDCAISTSGDTEQFVEIAGVRYSHVVDPRNGIGLTRHFMATVIAPRGITSDSLSKAVTILGPQAGDQLTQHYGARGFVRKVVATTSSTNP